MLSEFPPNVLVSITTIDADIENAYSQQASLQVERELSESMSLAVGYLHVRAAHVILSRNVDVPRFAASAGVFNLGRPEARFANGSPSAARSRRRRQRMTSRSFVARSQVFG